jgi:hypothetical protein
MARPADPPEPQRPARTSADETARGQDPPRQPQHSAQTSAAKAARASRVAEEMRKNLLKRKAQQRAQREKPRAP